MDSKWTDRQADGSYLYSLSEEKCSALTTGDLIRKQSPPSDNERISRADISNKEVFLH